MNSFLPLVNMVAILAVSHMAIERIDNHNDRITKLERSIPIPPLTTEEAVELMEGLD